MSLKNPGTPRRPAHGRPWLSALVLLVLTVLAYLPATRCEFIWDDEIHLTQNPCIIGPLGLKEIWTSERASLCPLVLTTFWVEHRLWGLNPVGYHVLNVLMHAAAALVLWRVLLNLKVPGAWLGAALWALHPVQVASVAWISEMKNTQSGLFFLLAILFYCKWRQREPGDERRSGSRFHYGLTLVFGALALASKSSTVVLPLVLGLCAWWMEGRWSWRRDLRELAPLLLLSVIAGVLTLWTQKLEGGEWGDELGLSWLQRALVAGRGLWFYLGKLLWPHPLVMIYPRWEIRAASAVAWLPVIGVGVTTLLLWCKRKVWHGRGRALWLGWIYFVLALLPVLGLVKQNYHRYSFVADHFQYLASMGPLALVGAGISVGLDGVKKTRRWLQVALCALLLLIFGGLTWRQCSTYQSPEVLWTATLQENPASWAAHNNLGVVLQQKGQLVEAQAHFQDALEIKPNFADAHNNLGVVLRRLGSLDEAVAHFEKAIEIKPDYAQAHNNLGNALGGKGQAEAAQRHYQKALEINPDYAEAHNNLGNVLLLKGRLEEAAARYQKALELNSGYADAHNNLGVLLQKKGRLAEALEHYQKAVEFNPGYAEAHLNLGNALQQEGRLEDAVVHYQAALAIRPNYPEAHNHLGFILQTQGKLEEAILHYQKALELIPDFAEAHRNFGVLLGRQGRVEEEVAHYQRALEINPDDAQSLNNLAYVLAASDNARVRNGARAVELAQRASRLTGGNDPSILGTLAAAQAEAGDFPAALETVGRAIRLAESQGNSRMSNLLRRHLKFYQEASPLRDKP